MKTKKPVKFELKKKPSLSDADRMQNAVVARAIQDLSALEQAIRITAGLQKKQHADLVALTENIAELNLRVRYVMEHFKFAKGSAIVGLDGESVKQEVACLFDLYQLQRDDFIEYVNRLYGETDPASASAEPQPSSTLTREEDGDHLAAPDSPDSEARSA